MSSDPSQEMVIRAVTPNITTLSLPFARFGIAKVGGRATIVRLTSGALAVFSPVALTPEVRTTLSRLNPNNPQISYITAPDLEHHIYLDQWVHAFPQAKVICPSGLPEKRASQQKPPIEFSTIFTPENKHTTSISEEFDQDFNYEYVDGHVNRELVFFYKPDKTLIQADLFFNLPATEQYSKTKDGAETGLATKIFGALMNTRGPNPWQKKVIWYGIMKDRKSFEESVKRIDGWGFERIVPCHGDVIDTDAKGVFRRLFDWQLNGAKEKGA